MKGFFNKQEVKSTEVHKGKKKSCAVCGRYKSAKADRLQPQGKSKKKILIVGCSPDKYEDKAGEYLISTTGNYLKRLCHAADIDIVEDCLFTTAVRCHTPTKYPTATHVMNCQRHVLQLIKERKPEKVILLGSDALRSAIAGRWERGVKEIDTWRGFKIPDQELKCWLYPMHHPQQILEQNRLELKNIFENDFKNAIEHIEPFREYEEPVIHYLKSNELYRLRRMVDSFVSIDYETTGVKPHAQGHRIACISVACNRNEAYVFMMPDNRADLEPYLELLRNEKVGKMAHNMKFEEHWSVNRLRQPVKNWIWDSMIAAHILDNRPMITSLKFQAFIRLGIVDYASEVSGYLKGIDEAKYGDNAKNKVLEYCKTESGRNELMKYCALDTIYQYRIALKQMKELNYRYDK